MAARIDVRIERALEEPADQGRDKKSNWQPERERHAEAINQDHRAIAARHGKSAMGEIDEIHQAESDRKPACQHEQKHAVSDTVEQDGQHNLLNARPPCSHSTPAAKGSGEGPPASSDCQAWLPREAPHL